MSVDIGVYRKYKFIYTYVYIYKIHLTFFMMNLGQEKPMKGTLHPPSTSGEGTCPAPVTAAVRGHLVSAQ